MTDRTSTSFSYLNRRDITHLVSLLAPLLFILIVTTCFHTFVIGAIKANIAINCGIILAASFGVVLIVMRMISAQQDFRIIERFGDEAKQGVYMKTLMEAPWLNKRYVRHYLNHIANTGGVMSSQMQQSAIESELHALQSDYDSRLELPQFLVGFMIAMGLLGTFIGLLETLTGISGMLDGMGGSGSDVEQQFMKLVVELRKPLAGMGIAFSASMFGLVTSLMLAVMMTNLRRYISRVISLARNVMHDLVELTRESSRPGFSSMSLSPNDAEALALIGSTLQGTVNVAPSFAVEKEETHVKTDSDSRGNRATENNVDGYLVGRLDVLLKKMEMLLEVFEANTNSSQKLNDLLGFGPRMKEISERTLEELKTISLGNQEQNRIFQAFIDGNADSIRLASSLLDTQRQARTESTGLFRDVSERLAKVEEAEIGSGRHLNDIKKDFTKLGKSLSMVDMIASSISGHTALLEALLEESRRSSRALMSLSRGPTEN